MSTDNTSSSVPPSNSLSRLLAEIDDALKREPIAHVYTMSGEFVRGIAALLRQPSPETPQSKGVNTVTTGFSTRTMAGGSGTSAPSGAPEWMASRPALPLSAGLQQSETLERLIVEAQYAIRAEPTTHIYTMSGRFVRDVLPLLRALLRQGRAEQPEPLDLAPIDHVAYVRDCLADPAVWPRLERPVLQALIDTIDRLHAFETVVQSLSEEVLGVEHYSESLLKIVVNARAVLRQGADQPQP